MANEREGRTCYALWLNDREFHLLQKYVQGDRRLDGLRGPMNRQRIADLENRTYKAMGFVPEREEPDTERRRPSEGTEDRQTVPLAYPGERGSGL